MKRIKTYSQFLNENYITLNENFETQTKKFIAELQSGDTSDPNAVEKVKKYMMDFDEIRNKKDQREIKDASMKNFEEEDFKVAPGFDRFDIDKYNSFKELEIFVDYVSSRANVGSANFEDIKVEGKSIVPENDDVEIFYADTPRACIEYKGKFPYGWCISRDDSSNMFYNYRMNPNEPAFYFVKRKKAMKDEFGFWNMAKVVFKGKFKDKFHFFVIQTSKDVKMNSEDSKDYIVTSAQNDGDIRMTWREILNFAPELKNYREVFQPKPLSPGERQKVQKYRFGISDDEFKKLPYKEKEFYLSVYVNPNKKLTLDQFKSLPEDLMNKYINFGVGLSDLQFEVIKNNSKLLKRYRQVIDKKFEMYCEKSELEYPRIMFHISELMNLTDNINKLRNLDLNRKLTLLTNVSEKDFDTFEFLEKTMIPKKQLIPALNALIWNEIYSTGDFQKYVKFILDRVADQVDKNLITKLLPTVEELEWQYTAVTSALYIENNLFEEFSRDEIIQEIIRAKRNVYKNSNEINALLFRCDDIEKISKILGKDNISKIKNLHESESDIKNLYSHKDYDRLVDIIIQSKNGDLDRMDLISLFPTDEFVRRNGGFSNLGFWYNTTLLPKMPEVDWDQRDKKLRAVAKMQNESTLKRNMSFFVIASNDPYEMAQFFGFENLKNSLKTIDESKYDVYIGFSKDEEQVKKIFDKLSK